MTAEPSNRWVSPATAVVATVGWLAATLAAARFGPPGTMLLAGPLGALLLLLLARAAGLSADEVGLGRRSMRRGAAYGLCGLVAVAVVYLLAAWLPVTRSAFLDERYRTDLGAALRTALVVIPLGTVLFEEVAFRGVLWGLVCAGGGRTRATLLSSGVFGLWHVLPSLRLNRVNPAVTGLVGPGPAGQILTVAGAVVFTAAAGVLLCELRRRSGSLLAPIGLHWAVNGLGVLVAAGIARWNA
ncbi:CPBP family intramembrane glutamic endopeptidase [Jidongwangia harbinensis]|uniref:CPBP family intramembrane glutamic endopeptidase n=1 Tax=Jidongwangia harbinensis TaxID=2878561 RepID=UPI001CD955EB|nr:CPBP family intramembrane glutamic endopeptidase [Jidongwangia harbinensis]MCA2211590.1 CPBP family intramembrane metalloprotease [Jidongwangia harbinensis]